MELKTYLAIINRRKKLIIGLMVILILLTVVVVRVIPPKYSSTAELRVMTPKNGGTNYVGFDINYATVLMNTYAAMVTSDAVQNALIKNLNLPGPADVSASVIANSELIKITAQARDPALSAAIANSVANLLVTNSSGETVNLLKDQDNAFQQRFTELDKELSQARTEYNTLMGPYTQNNAVITGLTSQIASDQQLYITLKDRYEQNQSSATVNPSQQTSLNSQLADLKSQITQEKSQLDALNAKAASDSIQIAAAQGTITLKEQQYTNLVNQQDQLTIIENMQSLNSLSVVQQADVPTSPTVPNALLFYSLGLILSVFLSAVIAFLVDNLDDTIHSSAQIELITQSVTLGKIIGNKHLDQANNTASDDAGHPDIARLQLNLYRISQTQELRSLAISSPDLHEDGTFLISRLAREYAKAGNRVIIVDANLHRPSIHNRFSRVKNDFGLSQYLLGRVPLEQTIKDTGINNLFVLPTGSSLSNAGMVLSSDKMKSLIEHLKSLYAVVLVNTAPILSSGDADGPVTFVDGVVLVVEPGKTHSHDLRKAVIRLQDLNAPFLGCVVNHADGDENLVIRPQLPKVKNLTA